MIEKKIENALRTIKKNDCFVIDTETGKEYTYAQCLGLARSISKQLQTLNNDSIVVILENSYFLFVLYFACIFAKITIIPIDPQKGMKEIEEILENHVGIPVVCDSAKLTGSYDIHRKQEFFHYHICDEIDMETCWQEVDIEELYMVTYTSGSTGKAKGVKHSLKNLFWSAISFGEKMGYGENTVLCHTMPMTYMAGILNTIFLPFIMHSKIVLFPRFSVMSAIYFWKNVMQFHINTFWLSPTMLNILLTIDKRGDIKEYFMKNSSIFHIGTAPLFPELKLAFESRYGVSLYQSYGLSETLLLTTAPKNQRIPGSSVGELLEEVHLQFDKDGEILISVPWMFLGYYEKDEAASFLDGYYRTGDFGEMRDQNLFITGRKKDLIVRGGINISPMQIEKEVYQNPDIQECCVSGVVIDGEEQTVCWYTTQVSEYKKLENQINKNLVDAFGINYKIDHFEKVESIAKNLNGKVDKSVMKKMFISLREGGQCDYKI